MVERMTTPEIIIHVNKGATSKAINITGWQIGEYTEPDSSGDKKRLLKNPEGKLYSDTLLADGRHEINEVEKKKIENTQIKNIKHPITEEIKRERETREVEEAAQFGRRIAEEIGEDVAIAETRAKVMVKLARRGPEALGEAIHLLTLYLCEHHTFITIRHDKNPATYYYDNIEGIYKQQGETKIKLVLDKILGEAYRSSITKEVIERVKIKTFVESEVITKIDDPYRIVCGNGVINLQTIELEPYSPTPRQFQKIPVEFHYNAECPNFIKFIEEVLPDKDKRNAVQEYIGYALLRNNRYEKYMLLYGSGANGKTILLNVIKECFGRENISSVKPQLLSNNKDPYATADLEKSLINIAGEISDETIRDSSSIKETASPETIRVRNPYETAKNVMPHAKHIWSANKLPKIKDQSDGMWRRILPIEFSSKYVDEHELETIRDTLPAHLQKNVHVKDVNLLDKLTTKEELEGVLAWAVKGYKRLSENGGFSYGGTPHELRLDYNKKADSVSAFFEEVVSEAIVDHSFIPKKELYESYCKYCGYLGVTPSSETAFSIHCKKVENLREDRMEASGISGNKSRPRCWLTINSALVKESLSRVVQGFPIVESTPSESYSKFGKNLNPGEQRLNGLMSIQTLDSPTLSKGGQNELLRSVFCGEYINKPVPIEYIITNTGLSERFIARMLEVGEIFEVTPGFFRLI